MNLTYEYIRHRRGYSFAAGCCWIRIYEGELGDAPVVVCEELRGVGGDHGLDAPRREAVGRHRRVGGGVPQQVDGDRERTRGGLQRAGDPRAGVVRLEQERAAEGAPRGTS